MIASLEDIKKIRRRFGLTQSELAKLSGVSQSLIAKLESGRIDPSFTKVKKIVDVLESINKKSEVKVSDIMTKRIISCSVNELVSKVVQRMRKYNISQLPVLEKYKIVGLVSERVLLDALSGKRDIGSLKVKEIMDEPPPIVSKNTSSRVVSHLLKHFPLVIVSSKGKYEGVITKSDALRIVSKVD